MSAPQNPVPIRSEKAKTGIFIARGADTLGPYNPDEAAALVVGGYLHTDDRAARDGDAEWVPLTTFLPASFQERPVPTPTLPAPPTTRRRVGVTMLGLAVTSFVVAGGMGWYEGRREVAPTAQPTPTVSPVPAPTPVSTLAPTPTPTLAAPAVEAPPTVPPAPDPDGPLRGSLDTPLAGVQITAYPLDALEAALVPVVEAALMTRQRLDPQIDAAAAELATRTAEEQAALRALDEAAPSDPLRRSLRFGYNGARTATRTAADNHRFLLAERSAAAGGETFFRILPAPTVTTETAADGSFTLDLPPDGLPYAVAAMVLQRADDGTVRNRRWLVRLADPQRSGHAPLRLDDTNSLTSSSEASLVQSVD